MHDLLSFCLIYFLLLLIAPLLIFNLIEIWRHQLVTLVFVRNLDLIPAQRSLVPTLIAAMINKRLINIGDEFLHRVVHLSRILLFLDDA